MKIAIVVDAIDNLTNGSVITARRFVDGLRARGHEVTVIAIGADGDNDCAVDERYVPVLTEVAAKNQTKFGKFNKKLIAPHIKAVDLVHFIFPFDLEKKCKKLADKLGVATTAAFHVQPENVSYNAHMGNSKIFNDLTYSYFKNTFYKKFKFIHCPSRFIADQLKKHGYKAKTYVISNGYDKIFVPPETREKNEKFEIAMIGRLSPEKNQQVLISAIAKSRHKDNIHLTLYGNGPCKERLIKQAEELGVFVDFDFLPKEELVKRLQKSDLYVHSAIVEIEAIACIEAIASGLVPVISDSDLSATPQFALDERSLFENDDPSSLSDKIDYWIDNEAERLEMGKRYAEHAKNYSLDKSLALAEKMFEDAISDKKAK